MSRGHRRDYRLRQPFIVTDKRTLAFLLAALRFAERRYTSPDREDMILNDPWLEFGRPKVQPLGLASFDEIADMLNHPERWSDADLWRPGRKATRRP